MKLNYDALLFLSFGGPDKPDDVMPFLENVVRGRNVPRERLVEVAEHYHHFGGKSPINEQNLALIGCLKAELHKRGYDLPIFWGNRNWHPYLPDTLQEMKGAGVGQALAFFTSAYSSYSGCRQYRENVIAATQDLGETAPTIHNLRKFYNHPGFLEPMADGLREAVHSLAGERIFVLFAAHSIPMSMAAGCRYEVQLREASRLCAELSGVSSQWELVYQSRSGPPTQPWLDPDICDRIRQLKEAGYTAVVVVPIGFISDHLEVLFDLDTEAQELCQELGLKMLRVATVGTDPRFVSMIVDLIEERCGLREAREALGDLGPGHDVCPVDCCLLGAGRPAKP